MTNEEKYKTAEERSEAYGKFCKDHICENCPLKNMDTFNKCLFGWLALEAEGEKLEPCPFCGRPCTPTINIIGNFIIVCTNCDYRYGNAMGSEATIAAHNHVCRAVAAYKESEVSHA